MITYKWMTCPRCKHFMWRKDGKQMGVCKRGGKEEPLIELDEVEVLADAILCAEFLARGKRK